MGPKRNQYVLQIKMSKKLFGIGYREHETKEDTERSRILGDAAITPLVDMEGFAEAVEKHI
jgi:hypothetical protein